ncbi:Aste57867_18259 [Aphanomyces stellatus]|uniref:Aste57867_18259 protein n=1 Tax=Aphanomyces stellatus TaxID=120398 RepID=A0A485LB82_9STRA|nr:hypothetical protein As57867_018197 [Aphanomyces stellatus]VFT94996.1 Aste57867_18259 [Aphanomyces stellatus]
MHSGYDNGDEVLCSGYLTKRGHVVTNWKMRFFVLRPHANLAYYEDESMGKKLGQVHLAKVAPWEHSGSSGSGSIAKRDSRGSSDDSRPGFMFVTTKRVVYYIYTSSQNEHQKWFKALQDFYVHASSSDADCQGYMTKKTPGIPFSFSRPKYYVLSGPVLKCYDSEDAYRSHDAMLSATNLRAASRWEDGVSFQGEAGSMLFLSAPNESEQQRWIAATQEKIGSALQPIACSGYLTKQGHKRKSWKRRYFVLRGHLLSYYKDYESANKQCLAEVGVEDVQVWDGESFGFMFITSEQVPYYVYAESDRERQKWLVALKAMLKAQLQKAPAPIALTQQPLQQYSQQYSSNNQTSGSQQPPIHQQQKAKVCPKCRHMVTVSKYCGSCGHHVDMPYHEPPPSPPRAHASAARPTKSRSPDAHRELDQGGQTLLIAVMQTNNDAKEQVEHVMQADTAVDHSIDDELDAALQKANLQDELPRRSSMAHGAKPTDALASNRASHNVIVVRPSKMADDSDYSESEGEHPNQEASADSTDDESDAMIPVLDSKDYIRESSFCELDLKGIVGIDQPRKPAIVLSSMEKHLTDTLGFETQWIPSRDADVNCRFYTSKNYNAADDVLVFVGDSGQLGVWKDETGLVNTFDHPMSMVPYIEAALKNNFGVVVCNPHANTVDVTAAGQARTFTVPYSSSPTEHLNFVWTNYLAAGTPSTTRVAIIAAGSAGKAVISLMQQEEASVYEKLKRIAFLQSTHVVDSSLSMLVLECLGRRAINWEASVGLSLCSQVVNSQARVGCVCMATGFKTTTLPDESATYPFDLTAEHLKHMQVPLFAYLTANPSTSGMTAVVKHMRATLKKGRSSSSKKVTDQAAPVKPTAEKPVSPTTEKEKPAVAADTDLANFYVPGIRGNPNAAHAAKKRQQAATGPSNITIKDFELLKVVGQGGFGKVFMATKVTGQDAGKAYAIKVLQKDQVVSNGLVHTTMAERHILIEVAHPFVVKLHYAFQSDSKLFLVMDYLSAGTLAVHLRKWRKFPENFARFYAAEVALAIAHLHQVNIIYRDVKLENVLMDHAGHVSIADFGLSKQGVSGLKGAKTFCGTAAYIAPELLKGQNYGKAADWWSFGILLYEMIAGKPPYYHRNRDIMFQTILTQQWVTFTPGFSDAAVDLIRGLLNRDPMQRLGSGPTGADEVLMHPFFKQYDWQQMLKRQVQPPYDPQVGPLDTVYVPRNVRQDGVTDRDRRASMLFSHDGDFRGFSFIGGQPPDLS